MYLITTVLLLISSPFGSDDDVIKEINQIKEQMKGYYSTNLDSAAILAEMILVKSKEAGYTLGEAKGEYAIAHVADLQGKIRQAIPHYFKALDIYAPIGGKDALTDQANICISLGVIYRQHHMYDKAIENYNQGIIYAQACGDNESLRKLLYNQSSAYRRNGNFTSAMNAALRNMELIAKNDTVTIQRTYNKIGLIYSELKDFNKAREWYAKVLEIDSPIFPRRRRQAYHNIALTYFKQKLYSKALEYYEKALSVTINYAEPKDLFLTYHDMAELALLEDQKGDALSYAQKALALIGQVEKTPEFYDLYLILSECLEDSDPTQALSYAKQYISETESFHLRQKELLEEEKKYRVKLAAMTYENQVLTEKYDRRILIGSIIIGVSIILMAIGLFKMLQNPMKYRYSVFQRHMKKLRKEEAKRLAQEHKKSTAKHLKALEETRKLLKK